MKRCATLASWLLFLPVLFTPSAAEAARSKVAVMDLRASKTIPTDLVESLTSLLSQELDRIGSFQAISSQDINQLLNFEKSRDQLGCDSVSCLAEVGGALGVDYLVTGQLTLVGQTYVLHLQLMNAKNASVAGRAGREYKGDAQGLLGEVRLALRELVRGITTVQSGELEIRVSEEGAAVSIDGSPAGITPLHVLTLSSGPHALLIQKDNFATYRGSVEVVPGKSVRANVKLLPTEDFVAAYRAHAQHVRVGAWISLSVGIASLAGTAALYVKETHDAADLNKLTQAYNANAARTSSDYAVIQQKQSALALTNTLTVGAGVLGLGGVILGAVLFANGDDPSRYDAPANKSDGPQVTGLSFGLNGLVLLGSF